MVEVVVVGTKEKEEEKYLMSTMNTNTVGRDAAAAADDHGGEEEKVTVVVIEAAAGTKVRALVDEKENKKIKSRTSTEQTTMSSTNVKAAEAAGDHPTVVVDGKKLKAWLIQLIMWSSVYFLLYWIPLVMMSKRDYYGITIFLHGIIPFSLLFFGTLVAGGVDTVNKINSLVLLVNNNISPSPGTFKSSTTSIDQMKKEISGAFLGVLLCSFLFNFIHMITMEFSKIIVKFIGKNEVGGSAKADDQHWYSPVMFAGCIFFVTLLHTAWYDHAISKELGLEDSFSMKQQQASATHTYSIDQPATREQLIPLM